MSELLYGPPPVWFCAFRAEDKTDFHKMIV